MSWKLFESPTRISVVLFNSLYCGGGVGNVGQRGRGGGSDFMRREEKEEVRERGG